MSENFLVLGATRNKGVSKKSNKKYDFSLISIGRKSKGAGEQGVGIGFSVDEFQLTNEAFDKLASEKFTFPKECALTFGVNSRKQVFVVDVGSP